MLGGTWSSGWSRRLEAGYGRLFPRRDVINEIHPDPGRPVTGDVLHATVRAGQAELLSKMVPVFPEVGDEVYNMDTKDDETGNTILHEAAWLGSLLMAKTIVGRRPSLLTERNKKGETPFFCAAANGKTELVEYIFEQVRGRSDVPFSEDAMRPRDDGSTALHVAVSGGFYDTASKIVDLYPSYIHVPDGEGMTALHMVAKLSMAIVPTKFLILGLEQRDSFHEQDVEFGFLAEFICSSIFKIIPRFICQKLYKGVRSHADASLESLVTKLVEDYAKYERIDEEVHVESPLEMAVRNGMLQVVEKVLDKYKLAQEDYTNARGENLLHLAIKHRQRLIFNFLRTMDLTKDLALAIDKSGNTILHHAARYPNDQETAEGVDGQAEYPMYWEHRWFKSVQKLIPPVLRKNRNQDGDTAEMLFVKTHKKTLKEDDDWAKSAATSYSVVSVLVASVASASIYAIPGGPNQNNGDPLLKGKVFFLIFIICDTLSVGAAFYSLLLFLVVLGRRRPRVSFSKTSLAIVQEGVSNLYNAILFIILAYIVTIVLYTDNSIIGWKIAFVLGYAFSCCVFLFARRIQKASLSAVRWYFY